MARIFLGWVAGAAMLLVAGPAAAAEKRFGLTSFDSIVLNADFVVEVTTRGPVSAVASGDQAALDRVELTAANGTLTISDRHYAGDENRRGPTGPVTIRVNATLLNGATLAGAGSLHIDRMGGASVQLGLRGPGALAVDNLTADRLSVAMIGNGTLTLGTGKAKRGQFLLSGAGVVQAGELAIDDLISDSEGTGDHVFRAVRTAAVTLRGIGRTVVHGKPACTVRNIGSGTVACGE